MNVQLKAKFVPKPQTDKMAGTGALTIQISDCQISIFVFFT